MKIITDFIYPPIPIRQFDWSAVTDNYDGDSSPIGRGETKQQAIDDLLDQICKDHGADVEGQLGACLTCGAETGVRCRIILEDAKP